MITNLLLTSLKTAAIMVSIVKGGNISYSNHYVLVATHVIRGYCILSPNCGVLGISRVKASTSFWDYYFYGALGKMVTTTIIRSQTIGKQLSFFISKLIKSWAHQYANILLIRLLVFSCHSHSLDKMLSL